MCSPKGLIHYPAGHMSAAACAKLGATARKMPSWKAYRDATKDAPTHIYTPRATRATLADCNKARATAIAAYKRETAKLQRRMDAERIAAAAPSPIDRANALPATRENHARPHHAYSEPCESVPKYDGSEGYPASVSFPCTMLRGQPCNKCRTGTTTRKAALAALRA